MYGACMAQSIFTHRRAVALFKKVDEDWCCSSVTDDSGSTATVAVLKGRSLTIAQLGDSRAVLIDRSGNCAFPLPAGTGTDLYDRRMGILSFHIALCTYICLQLLLFCGGLVLATRIAVAVVDVTKGLKENAKWNFKFLKTEHYETSKAPSERYFNIQLVKWLGTFMGWFAQCVAWNMRYEWAHNLQDDG